MTSPVILVVNPMSQAGRTGRRLEQLSKLARAALGPVEVRTTRALGDGRRLAREAAEGGASLVIAVGGDGTANEVVDGLMSAAQGPCAFGLLPAGTGSDLARTLAMPTDWEEALVAIRHAAPQPTDVMVGTFTDVTGKRVVRHGINVVGMGMAGEVVRRVNRSSKRLGGQVSFLTATLGALVAWRAPEVEITWDDEDGAVGRWVGPLVNAFVANGRYCGGSMLVGAEARMEDGLLDVVVVPRQSLWRLALSTPHLYDGRIAEQDDIVSFRTARVAARPVREGFVPSDMDGEQPGGLPAEIRCLAGALPVRAPWRDGVRGPSVIE